LLAQAAAVNTPCRKNIRLENAKLHLRSFKSIGKNLIFESRLTETFLGEIAPFVQVCLERRTGSKLIVPGMLVDFQQQIAILGKTSVIVVPGNVTQFALFLQFER
jgi:hypothetical protein